MPLVEEMIQSACFRNESAVARKDNSLPFQHAEDNVVHDMLARVSVDSAEGVVQDVNVCVLVYRTCKPNALLLPAGEIDA